MIAARGMAIVGAVVGLLGSGGRARSARRPTNNVAGLALPTAIVMKPPISKMKTPRKI